MATTPGFSRSRRGTAALWRARVVGLLVLALAAGCGSTPPTGAPSASGAAPASSPAAATTKPSARPGATTNPSASTASPSPSAPAIAGATQVPCPGRSTAARRGRVTTGQSRNWAGYIVGATKGHVTCVEGTWTQPKVQCPASGSTSVAIWVGIDGSTAVGSIPDASATLAQTGTVADCANGKAQYGAWYEFLPDLRHIVPFGPPVGAGDKVWAQVRWYGNGKFIATLINLTQRVGTTQAWTLKLAPLLTAEWIVEDPAASCSGGSCTYLTLAHFSTVYLNGSVTLNGAKYKLSSVPFPYLRTSSNRSGKVLAAPSSLGTRGFSVAWKSS